MSRLAIKASGLVTPVGFNSAASCAAMRAGIRNVQASGLWDEDSDTYLGAGKVPLPQWWIGIGKLAELVAPAIHECLVQAKPVPPTEIPVFLCLSGPTRPCRFPALDDEILGEVQDRLGFRFHPASRLIARDHVSVVVALQAAQELLRQGPLPYCIVAAVDSLIQQNLAEYYLKQRRLLHKKNSNGFSPGEAGSAVLVAPETRSGPTRLEVLGMGMAREKSTIESEEPLRAEGLIEAIKNALEQAGIPMHETHYRITDQNGEHYKFKELALALIRLERTPRPKFPEVWHPIEYIGDVGAAIGPLLLAVALTAGQKGYGIGPTALCTLGNDDGERAAMVVRFTREGDR